MCSDESHYEFQRRILRSLVGLGLLAWPVGILAQTAPIVIGGGYHNPDLFQVAPGQVIAIFLRDVPTLLPLYSLEAGPYRFVIANSVPLATSLAGFSARVDRLSGDIVEVSVPAPILAVQQLPDLPQRRAFSAGGMGEEAGVLGDGRNGSNSV